MGQTTWVCNFKRNGIIQKTSLYKSDSICEANVMFRDSLGHTIGWVNDPSTEIEIHEIDSN